LATSFFAASSVASGSSSILSCVGFDLVGREDFEVDEVLAFFDAGPDLGAEAERWG
jgi:hypothetical protein